MLIAFVLLGKNLEQRAKIKAASDMTGLLNILPAKARLLINSDEEELSSTVDVPCSSLSVGDQIIVLPGVRKVYLVIMHIIHFLSGGVTDKLYSYAYGICLKSTSFIFVGSSENRLVIFAYKHSKFNVNIIKI